MKKFILLLTLFTTVMTITPGAAGAESTGSTAYVTTLDEFEEMISENVYASIDELTTGCNELIDEIDSFDKYLENADKVGDFYDSVLSATEALYIDMRAYSIDCMRLILTSDEDIDDKCSVLTEWIDAILEDGCDETYYDICDYVLDDTFEAVCDAVFDESYDEASHSDRSNVLPYEFGNWSYARSYLFGEWHNCRSEIFGFWTNLMGELLQGDIEGALDETDDFQVDVERLAKRAGHSIVWHVAATTWDDDAAGADAGDAAITEEAEAIAPPVPTATPTETAIAPAVTDEVTMKR